MMVLKEAPAQSGLDMARNRQRSRVGGGANLAGNMNANESSCSKVLETIMEKNMAPAIVFSFSKKECEAYAMIASKGDYNSDEEKKLVQQVFSNAISILSDEDQKLPQVESVLPLLKKGIGLYSLLVLFKFSIKYR